MAATSGCIDSDSNFERKLLTEVNNEVGSRAVFSQAQLQSEFFLKPVESPPSGHRKEQCKVLCSIFTFQK